MEASSLGVRRTLHNMSLDSDTHLKHAAPPRVERSGQLRRYTKRVNPSFSLKR